MNDKRSFLVGAYVRGAVEQVKPTTVGEN